MSDLDYGQSPASQAIDELSLLERDADHLHELALLRWERLAPFFEDEGELGHFAMGACVSASATPQPTLSAFLLGFQIGAVAERVRARRDGEEVVPWTS